MPGIDRVAAGSWKGPEVPQLEARWEASLSVVAITVDFPVPPLTMAGYGVPLTRSSGRVSPNMKPLVAGEVVGGGGAEGQSWLTQSEMESGVGH